MSTTALIDTNADRHDGVSFARLLWVAPLTVVVAVVVNQIIKAIVIALNPALAEMEQLSQAMITLALEGAILAVIVFALMVWLVPHPIRWFRIVAVIALVISLIHDLLLGFEAQFYRASPGGGGPPSGGRLSPAEVLPGLPWDRVFILMLLHAATAVVCIVMLTTLTREPREGAVTDFNYNWHLNEEVSAGLRSVFGIMAQLVVAMPLAFVAGWSLLQSGYTEGQAAIASWITLTVIAGVGRWWFPIGVHTTAAESQMLREHS